MSNRYHPYSRDSSRVTRPPEQENPEANEALQNVPGLIIDFVKKSLNWLGIGNTDFLDLEQPKKIVTDLVSSFTNGESKGDSSANVGSSSSNAQLIKRPASPDSDFEEQNTKYYGDNDSELVRKAPRKGFSKSVGSSYLEILGSDKSDPETGIARRKDIRNALLASQDSSDITMTSSDDESDGVEGVPDSISHLRKAAADYKLKSKDEDQSMSKDEDKNSLASKSNEDYNDPLSLLFLKPGYYHEAIINDPIEADLFRRLRSLTNTNSNTGSGTTVSQAKQEAQEEREDPRLFVTSYSHMRQALESHKAAREAFKHHGTNSPQIDRQQGRRGSIVPNTTTSANAEFDAEELPDASVIVSQQARYNKHRDLPIGATQQAPNKVSRTTSRPEVHGGQHNTQSMPLLPSTTKERKIKTPIPGRFSALDSDDEEEDLHQEHVRRAQFSVSNSAKPQSAISPSEIGGPSRVMPQLYPKLQFGPSRKLYDPRLDEVLAWTSSPKPSNAVRAASPTKTIQDMAPSKDTQSVPSKSVPLFVPVLSSSVSEEVKATEKQDTEAEKKPTPAFGWGATSIKMPDSADKWKCPTCDVRNNNDLAKCPCCDTAKPGGKPTEAAAPKLPSFFAPPSGSTPSVSAPALFTLGAAAATAALSAAATFTPPTTRAKEESTAVTSAVVPPPAFTVSAPLFTVPKPAIDSKPSSSAFTPAAVPGFSAPKFSFSTPTPAAPTSIFAAPSFTPSATATAATSIFAPKPTESAPDASVSTAPKAAVAGWGSTSIKMPDSAEKWKCPTCDVHNSNDLAKCPCCDTAKPGGSSSSGALAATTPNLFGFKPPAPMGASAAASLFGVKPESTTAPAAPSLFGAKPESTTAPVAPSLFGAKPESTATPALPSMFGSMPPVSTTTPASSTMPAPSPFAFKPPSSSTAPAPATPSMFEFKPPSSTAASTSLFEIKPPTSATTSTTSLFDYKPPASISTPAATPTVTSTTTSTAPIFEFKSPSLTAPTATSSMFELKPPASSTAPTTPSPFEFKAPALAATSSATPSFGTLASTTSSSSVGSLTSFSAPGSSLFSSKPTTNPFAISTPGATPSLLGSGTASTSALPSATSAPPPLFGAPASTPASIATSVTASAAPTPIFGQPLATSSPFNFNYWIDVKCASFGGPSATPASFGSNTSGSTASAAFSFGAPPSTSSQPPSMPTFSFNNPATTTAPVFGAGASTPAFGFGAKPAISSGGDSKGSGIEIDPMQASNAPNNAPGMSAGSGFGGFTSTQPSTGFGGGFSSSSSGFGGSNSGSSGFGGVTSAAPIAFGSGTTVTPMFGSGAPAASMFGGGSSMQSMGFGAGNASQTASFGQPAAAAGGGGGFGAPAPGFGGFGGNSSSGGYGATPSFGGGFGGQPAQNGQGFGGFGGNQQQPQQAMGQNAMQQPTGGYTFNLGAGPVEPPAGRKYAKMRTKKKH
ncbi:hypothetical protein BGZ76_011304 [Entomortierella beljakovae]|nr:hypothetical protein BGZ76_011304 [Entomortierella beljakovae]